MTYGIGNPGPEKIIQIYVSEGFVMIFIANFRKLLLLLFFFAFEEILYYTVTKFVRLGEFYVH